MTVSKTIHFYNLLFLSMFYEQHESLYQNKNIIRL